jgi:hypothetical protein
MSHLAINQTCYVLKIGTSIVKPLGINVKKAVEKSLNRKIKNHVLW